MRYGLDFLAIMRLFGRFAAYRCGLTRQRPDFMPDQTKLVHAAGPFFGWPDRFRLLGAHHCPAEGPAVFVANHVNTWDPAYTVKAIVSASAGRLKPYTMMRDDFFRSADDSKDGPRRLAWGDDLMEAMGGVRITRGNPQLSQMRPLFTLLKEGGVFIMYPNGTRTRSGMFFEYRDGVNEPGAVSFFLAHGRPADGAPVPAVPLGRTLNLVERSNTMIFGPPHQAPADHDRAAQRAFDRRLAEAMSALVEVNVPQVTCAVLYLRALHHRPPAMTKSEVTALVRRAFAAIDHPYIAPVAEQDLEGAVGATLGFLRRHGLVTMRGATIELVPGAWLNAPPVDGAYRKRCPARYMINQILHLENVAGPIQSAVLAPQASASPSTRRA